MRYLILGLILTCIIVLPGCFGSSEKETAVLRFPVSSADDLANNPEIKFDQTVTSDGDGSIFVDTDEPVTLDLYSPDSSGMGHSRIVYRAKLKTEDLKGEGEEKGIAYLELRVVYPDGKELVSRGPRIPPSGTTDWTPAEADLYLDRGVNPKEVTLALGVDGGGRVWADELTLESRPLRIDYLFWGNAVVWIALIIYIYHLLTKQRSLRKELESLEVGAGPS